MAGGSQSGLSAPASRFAGPEGVEAAELAMAGMRTKLFFTFLFLTNLALAQELPKVGDVYQAVSCDLNRDGKAEKLELVAYNINTEAEMFWGRLRVKDAAGKVLWEAPQATETEQPFAFGMWPYGVSGLEWVGDIDGDGKVELISPAPVSDVRPQTYRRFRWTGRGFEALSPKMLLETPAGSGKFLWRDPIEWDGQQPISWVSQLSGGPGKCVGDVTSSRADGVLWGGQAQFRGDGLGLTATSWLKKLGPYE